MTTRVFDCGLRPRRLIDRAPTTKRAGRSLAWGIAGSLVLVPLAGAADAPRGWFSGALGALCVLGLFGLLGRRARLGWLLLVVGGLGLAVPRDPLAALGPPLFVASGLLCILWLANRDPARRRRGDLTESEREAQRVMGRSGELHVRTTLAAELPEDYVLMNGVSLPHAAGDIDHLVIGPSGVFLLETKTMAGQIECDAAGNWRRTRVGRAGTSYGAYIGDPAAQVMRNIHAVRQCLRMRLPHLFWGTPLWIEGLVVFPHPATSLSTEHSRVPALRLDEAARRICNHQPQRILQPHEVIEVTAALLEERQTGLTLRRSAQALVELAMTLPVLLALVFGTVALSRIVQAHSAIVTIAHEVARAGALGSNANDAVLRMRERTGEVTPGLGLDAVALDVTYDAAGFGRADGQVIAGVRYAVTVADLPLVGWVPPVELRVQHAEWVDPLRAGVQHTLERGP